jgi:2-polyprenyl-3-methyl-5-hydroxy-6-metoxy-1,4-benzoquinol methylase
VEAYCGDVTNAKQIGDGEADLIVCTQVIEHVPDDKVLLNEISRQLRVGGIAYVASLVKKKYGWFYYRTKYGKWALDPTHAREYCSKEEFEDLFIKAGFSIIEAKMTQLKLSFIEFMIRRVILKFVKIDDINSVFFRHPWLDRIRKFLMVPIVGYYFIDIIIEKRRP